MVTFYRPPDDDAAIERFADVMDTVCTPNRTVIALGDFNLPEIVWRGPHAHPTLTRRSARALSFMDTVNRHGLTLLVAGSWLPLLVARGGCLGPPLDISGSYRSIFKIQTAFVSPQHDLHF